MIASVLFMEGEVVVAEDMVSADAMLQEQVTQSKRMQLQCYIYELKSVMLFD